MKSIRQQKRELSQAAAAVPANVHPPSGPPAVFTWDQIEKIRKVNTELASFDHFSNDHPGGQ